MIRLRLIKKSMSCIESIKKRAWLRILGVQAEEDYKTLSYTLSQRIMDFWEGILS
jgi:hypothetical protein